MQLNASIKTKLGELQFELINDVTDFRRKIEGFKDDYYYEQSRVGDLLQNAGKLAESLSYFKDLLLEVKNKNIFNNREQ